jgi:methyltransferase (TIGR00027 family)
MTAAAAKTGLGPTVIVAIEQGVSAPQRILVDDLARRMLPLGARAFVWLMRPAAIRNWMIGATERRFPGLWAGVLCRKRYIDEKLIQAVGGIDAVVNLGAGFDTRCYRLPLGEVPAWEIDQPANIEAKRARLRSLFRRRPAQITPLPVDFDREDLQAVLTSRGYATRMRTFFVWEAVSQYLAPAGIDKTFRLLAAAASGSRLCFTYVRKDFIDGRAMYGW